MEEAQKVPGQRRGDRQYRGRPIPRKLSAEDVASINAALDDLELAGDERKTGWLLFCMLHAGTTDPYRIWRIAGLDLDFVKVRYKRLRENGIIPRPHCFNVQWFDDDPKIAALGIVLDILVAEGSIVRIDCKDKDGRPRYQARPQDPADILLREVGLLDHGSGLGRR